jgi:O-antigen/teichoic acid export membrane protein
MNSARNLLTGAATKYVVLGVNVGLGVVLLPFTMRHLGPETYGLWMLAASLTYYFQLLDLGYGTGLVRHVSDADARGQAALVNRVLSTFFVVFAGLGLVAALGLATLIVWAIPRFPNLTSEQVWQAQVVLAILGARIVVGLPMTVFGAATTARQRYALNNGVAIAVALANAAVTYFVLSAGFGLIPLVASTTAVGLLSYVGYAWTARLAMPELRIRLRSFSRPLVREVSAFSVYLFLISVAAQIGFNLDNLVIGAALGTSAVAIYAIAFRIADYQRQLCNQLNSLLFPVVVRLEAAARSQAMRAMMIDATRIALSLVTFVTICVLAYAQPLIARWMGSGFEAAVAPVWILALAGVVLVGQGPLGNVLLGTGRHRLVAFTSLGEAAANCALSLLLVRKYGIAGVAAGTAIPVVIANLGILLPAACRQVNVPVLTFLRLVGRAPLVATIPTIVVCALWRAMYPEPGLAAIVLQCALAALVYGLALCFVGLERDVRDRYLAHLRRAIRTAPATSPVPEAVS